MRRHLLTLTASTFFLTSFAMSASAQQNPGASSATPGDPSMMQNQTSQAQMPQAQMPQAQQQAQLQRDRDTVGRSYRDDDDDDDYDDYHHRRMMRGWMHDHGFGGGSMRDRDDARDGMQDRGQGRMMFGMGPGMGGPFMMRMIMALMDTDNDGTISLQEFQTAHERIFRAMDTNHDGRLTPEELQNFMSGTRTTAQQQPPAQQQTPAQPPPAQQR